MDREDSKRDSKEIISSLYVWGRGGDGQLGIQTLKDEFFPILNVSKGLNFRGIL
jgi:hypothetical protein